MAEVQRKRTMVNPGRKKRRNPKRKMSAKQIAHFGTARQKAALKASRKRKRKPSARRHSPRTNAAPRRARASRRAARPKRRHRTRRSNPGGIIDVALSNPAPKRRKTVARRKRRSSHKRRTTHRRRTNPAPVARTRRRRTRRASVRHNRRRSVRRSNPGVVGSVTGLLSSALYAIGGAVGSQYATQALLGPSNAGIVGYASQLGIGVIGGQFLGRMMKNRQAGNMISIGAAISVAIRALKDQTPLGATLAQYGLGDYEASTWLSPARYVNAAQSAQVDIPTALRPQLVAAKGMAGLRGSGTYSKGRGTY